MPFHGSGNQLPKIMEKISSESSECFFKKKFQVSQIFKKNSSESIFQKQIQVSQFFKKISSESKLAKKCQVSVLVCHTKTLT